MQPLREGLRDRDELGEHVERRHPKADVHWWVVAEDPRNRPFEVDD